MFIHTRTMRVFSYSDITRTLTYTATMAVFFRTAAPTFNFPPARGGVLKPPAAIGSKYTAAARPCRAN